MWSSNSPLGAHLAAVAAAARATIGDLRPANAGASKTHQIGDLVVDPVTGQLAKVIYVSTKHIHAPHSDA